MASCNILFDSQMLVMGGIPEEFQELTCDTPEVKGQHGLLLGQGNNVEWRTLMSSVESYLVPGVLTSMVGGGYVSFFKLLSSVLIVEQVFGKCHGDSTC